MNARHKNRRWTLLAALLGLAAMLIDTGVHVLAARMAWAAGPGSSGRIAIICSTLGIAAKDQPGAADGSIQADSCPICLHAAAVSVHLIPPAVHTAGSDVRHVLNNRGPPSGSPNAAS